MSHVIVYEHASLTTEACSPTLSLAKVSATAFEYLCQLSEGFKRSGATLLQIEGQRRLRLDGYVGVIQTPCGTTVEVLPKHMDAEAPEAAPACRRLLRKLIQSFFDVPSREVGDASLETFKLPLHEWLMQRFVEELDRIVQRGVRFSYQRVEEEQPFLRGQLNVVAQLRQPPGRAHYFQIRHDVFTPDRPENRLLRAALERVRKLTQQPDTWRLAQELSLRLVDIPISAQIEADFNAWRNDRLVAHYQAARPWCELILRQMMPLAVHGPTQGMSLLFSMDKLFERHVATWLRNRLDGACRIRTPAASEYLCRQGGEQMFRLEPDILLEHGPQRKWVLDAKWKVLDETDRDDKYGMSQADLYQLFAYGHKYMGGAGDMALIYPMSPKFRQPLQPFSFSDELRLHVVPFDLEADHLIESSQLTLPMARLRASLSTDTAHLSFPHEPIY
ncbi:McrC family protein [Delftia sp. PS-11]|uniref:McrC family protein n=1 Tax=Delftia sp. PS-11 TaxID=2767222 RepID=UPI002454B211|nr:McrC family protein [Delftia sp. PS-11]KAJ8744874.1 McrC family protein [Delftia sp. PS-11]